jgi:hypothetical protein
MNDIMWYEWIMYLSAIILIIGVIAGISSPRGSWESDEVIEEEYESMNKYYNNLKGED